MTVVSEVNIEAVVETLLVSENPQAVLSSFDTPTRLAIRLDAMCQIADLVIYEDFAAADFYWEILSLLDSPAAKPVQLTRREKVAVEPMYRVPDVAQRIGMSEDWVRRNFEKVQGVKILTSPRRRGRREYSILLIPQSVLERELAKMCSA